MYVNLIVKHGRGSVCFDDKMLKKNTVDSYYIVNRKREYIGNISGIRCVPGWTFNRDELLMIPTCLNQLNQLHFTNPLQTTSLRSPNS